MKNILVATDFSYDAYNALFYITRLMASNPCTLYILNVYEENKTLKNKKSKLFGSKNNLTFLQIQSKEMLTETRHKIVLENGNSKHQLEIISEYGNLTKVIKNIIDAYAIDLVVMGSKGTTGAAEIFLGSNTIKVAKNITQCPILAVPKQIDYKTPKTIAFVTDFKNGCGKETLKPLLFLASLTNATIVVMHINEEEILSSLQESYKKLLTLSLANFKFKFIKVQDYANKAEVINTFLEKENIDLFAMIYHKRSLFEKLVKEPVIKNVNLYTHIPFLILNNMD
ncbi:universal stress protein UspA [Croceivirga lutea]|uniref:universal stress protein n=1 Tax=Croceivirga lutea TaxID=1775167 RepID=UPI0016395E9A|nr:universal stress protein [Croceivirga lutea]GGG43102.1 universal stress protein UspA [Croceivirga lutea]